MVICVFSSPEVLYYYSASVGKNIQKQYHGLPLNGKTPVHEISRATGLAWLSYVCQCVVVAMYLNQCIVYCDIGMY